MASILNILNELSASLGYDAVRAACVKFSSSKHAHVPVVEKVKKERKPRGKSSWNVAVDKVLAQMRADYLVKYPCGNEKTITYKMAYHEASKQKRANNPDAQLAYDKYRSKVEEKRAAKRAAKGDAPAPAAPEPAAPEPAPAAPAPETTQPEAKKRGKKTA